MSPSQAEPKPQRHRRFLVISQYWSPDVVGDVSRVEQVVGGLRRLGCAVTVITSQPHYPRGDRKGYRFRPLSASNEDGVLVFRIGMPTLSHAGFARRFLLYSWFAAAALVPSLVLGRKSVHWAFSQRVFSTYSSIPARVFLRRTVVSDVTDIWPEAVVNTGYMSAGSVAFRMGRIAARCAYLSSSRITTMTTKMRSYLAVGYGVPPPRVSIVPYGGHPWKKAGSSSSRFTVLYYGNLGPAYDFEAVLKIAYILRREEVSFVIRADGEGLGSLVRQSRILELQNVRFIPEALSESDLDSLVSEAAVLLLPMRRQTFTDASFPGKLVEYVQCGKPIVLIGDGLPAEIVAKNEVGLVVPAGDYNGGAKAIISIKKDAPLRERFFSNSRALQNTEFSEKRFNYALSELVTQLD